MRGGPFSSGGRSDRDHPGPSRTVTPRFFAAKEYRCVERQEPHTKSKKNFPVELRAKTSEQTNLTNNPADDEYPSWSPDGNKIAFASKRDGNSEVYIMNVISLFISLSFP